MNTSNTAAMTKLKKNMLVKSHKSLSAIIELELNHDPFAGHFYAFTNRN